MILSFSFLFNILILSAHVYVGFKAMPAGDMINDAVKNGNMIYLQYKLKITNFNIYIYALEIYILTLELMRKEQFIMH